MIGRESAESPPMSLAASEAVHQHIALPYQPVALTGFEVRGDQQCVLRPQEGLAVASVWEEARKALKVQEWTENESGYRYRILTYDRDLDANARTVQAETRRVTSGVGLHPIRSLAR